MTKSSAASGKAGNWQVITLTRISDYALHRICTRQERRYIVVYKPVTEQTWATPKPKV